MNENHPTDDSINPLNSALQFQIHLIIQLYYTPVAPFTNMV